jgi:GT2 family glycosyltransferase/glycosyltransferase involved in cell wall biosynthesis
LSPTKSGVVSVIIVNFRGTDDTLEAVTRLNEVEWPVEKLEIVVVENGSGDDSAERLTAALGSQENVTIIVSDDNLGFTGGSNLGAKNATGEFLAFLNNDAKPAPGWIAGAIGQFEVSPRVAAVGSKVLDWEGKTIDFVDGSVTWFGMGFKNNIAEPDDGRFDEPKDILFGTGSALFVRAAVFAEVGGFDERLFMFYDDVDLGWRLNVLGYRVRFAPQSVVYHKHHGSMKSFGEYREMYLLERNALFVLYKNLSDENLSRFLPAALALLGRRAVAKSGLDPETFDIRRFTGADDEFDPTTPVAKDTLAGLFALDQFVSELPALDEARAEIQSKRTRTDDDLMRLFGNIVEPLFHHPYFLEGYSGIVETFQIRKTTKRRRVLVITGDSLGLKMAGPAMRAWKISEALSKENDVRLVTWNVASRASNDFEVHRVRLQNEREMRVHEEWADVIVFQGHALHHFKTLQSSDKIMVADIYDPMHLEQLEQGREFGTVQWNAQVAGATEVLNQQLARCDFFLCASERQRMFWLGQLAGLGRVNPYTYMADSNLDSLISVVPFGMDAVDPVHDRKAIRGVVPGISDDDKVVIWGGGIYNWFDTFTLVRAIAKLAETRPNVRLFFLGVRHPNPDVPEMAIVAKTRELAAQLGVADRNVFFNENWVALDDRHNYLLEADAGVSTHYDHIETIFSFRTRILDYLWARLPIVTTEGDSFGDLVGANGMGVSVPEKDIDALADALEKVLYNPEFAAEAREAIEVVREEFFWENALRPLIEFCRDPQPAPDRKMARPLQSGSSHDGRGKKKQQQSKTPEERLHAIATSRHGVARDVALARFYISEGGVDLLRQKVRNRMSTRERSRREVE